MDNSTVAALPALSTPGDDPARRTHEQIDHITYLASLASRRDEVDVMMDTLRKVTSRWNGTGPLDSRDQEELNGLENQLKDYLVRVDPLRDFTLDTLEQRLQGHRERKGLSFISSASYSLLVVILVTIAATGLCLVVPYTLPFQTRLLLTVPVMFAVLHIGIVWFCLTSLKNFKPDVRRIFLYFSAAAVVFALGFCSYVAVPLFDLNRYPAFRYAGISILYGLPLVLIYFSMRLYAKLLAIPSRLSSLKVAFGITAGVMVPAMFLPHAETSSELFFDLTVVTALLILVFGTLASVLAASIHSKVTAAYAKPMAVLMWYLRVIVVAAFVALIALFIVGELKGGTFNFILAFCGIPPQSLLLYASYLFKRETSK